MAAQTVAGLGRVGAVAAVGVVLSLLAAVGVHRAARHRDALTFERRARDVASTMRAGFGTTLEVVRTLPPMFVSGGTVGRARFERFVTPALRRHPGLAALEWIAIVPDDARTRFEALVARETPGYEVRELAVSGAMLRAASRPRHMALVYMVPFEPRVLGLDMAFDPLRIAPIDRALTMPDELSVSDRFRLVEDAEGVHSVAVYIPIETAWLDGAPDLRLGVGVALFRLRPLVETALTHVELGGAQLVLSDPVAPRPFQRLYESRAGLDPAAWRGDVLHVPVPFADRTWDLAVLDHPASTGASPWITLFAGLVATAAAALALWSRGRISRLETRVADTERLGQYELEGEVGHGASGTVYRARHTLLRRPTALKLLSGASDPAALARFEREVLLTCRLTHPNTVAVYDFGTTPQGAFYCAMELIEGFNFESLVRLAGPLPAARVIRLVQQACASLAEAHDAGLVHRDVKPANLMLCVRGGIYDFVKVLDFGLARARREPLGAARDSAVGAIAGTPGYIPPEVLLGEAPDAAGDLYALGCVAYFLLTGTAPVAGDTIAETCARTLSGTIPTPTEQGAGAVPASLERAVMACLERSPRDRPADVRELAARLRACLPDCAPWTESDARAWWTENTASLPPAVPRDAVAAPLPIALSERP